MSRAELSSNEKARVGMDDKDLFWAYVVGMTLWVLVIGALAFGLLIGALAFGLLG